MRIAFRISLLAIGLVSLLGAALPRPGPLVEFPNTSDGAFSNFADEIIKSPIIDKGATLGFE